MAIKPARDQIVAVDSVNPADSQSRDGYFADIYHHLLTSSWPFLLLQITAAFFAINALFAVAYYFDGGIKTRGPVRSPTCSSSVSKPWRPWAMGAWRRSRLSPIS